MLRDNGKYLFSTYRQKCHKEVIGKTDNLFQNSYVLTMLRVYLLKKPP